MRIRTAKFNLLYPASGGGGWNRLTANLIESAPIFISAARFYNALIHNPKSTPISSSAAYDDLINAAGRHRDFATVRHLLIKRVKDGCFNTTNTFKFISTDASILPDLLKNLAAIDDWFSRKHAHDALIAKLARLYRTREALRVAETMANKNYGATSLTFRPILNEMTRKKDTKAAWGVVEVMRVCNVKPDLTGFNHILTAYCSLGDLMSAADVLVKLEEEGMGADQRTYDALVLGVCRARKLEVALRVMRRMVEDEMVPLDSTHGHVMREMVKSGYIAQAVEYVKIFAGMNKRLDAENFRFLVLGLRNVERMDEAKSVLEEMEKRGLPISDELKRAVEI